MKKITMRSLAWLTSLMLCVSLFAAAFVLPVGAATVDYVYSGSYVYNWGTREEVATFLSPMAEEWYDKYNTDYDDLASLSGSSSTSSVPSSALYKELQSLMKGAHKKQTSYGYEKSNKRFFHKRNRHYQHKHNRDHCSDNYKRHSLTYSRVHLI